MAATVTFLLALSSALVPGDSAVGGTYTVRKNDTLSSIAQRHGVGVGLLVEANSLRDQNRIFTGQRLMIPEPGTRRADSTILVQKHDTLSEIAERHGLSVAALARANRLNDSNHIFVGQKLLIPGGGREFELEPHIARALDRIRVTDKKWRYIVIHHSATSGGTMKGLDAYHRRERHMENGLAYHFVIGNGSGIPDGNVEIGNRWVRQLDGGHLASLRQNRVSIGICLIGNFEESAPTAGQMESLNALVDYLLDKCRLPSERVKTHRDINVIGTICPGEKFPEEQFLRALKGRRSSGRSGLATR